MRAKPNIQAIEWRIYMVYYLIRVNQNILSDKVHIQGNEEKTKKAKVISPRFPDFLSAISCFQNTGKITFRIEKNSYGF